MTDASAKKTILFDTVKHESCLPSSNLKKLIRRLKSNIQTQSNLDEITVEKFSVGQAVLFIGQQEEFAPQEIEELKKYMASGGSIGIFVGEGASPQVLRSLNSFVQEYGITINTDSVVRASFYKYMHPKEVFISHGILHPDLSAKKNTVFSSSRHQQTDRREVSESHRRHLDGLTKLGSNSGLIFVYPYGSSLTVTKPSMSVLSSGPASLPFHVPLCAVYSGSSDSSSSSSSVGRILVFGSSEILTDDWIDKEENFYLIQMLLAWLVRDATLQLQLDKLMNIDQIIGDGSPIPNIESMAQSIRPCLQESSEIPSDVTKLFSTRMHSFNTSQMNNSGQIFKKLNLPRESLTLIQPEFEAPLPPLEPSTFPPIPSELAVPSLELYDLDDHFSTDEVRLAQVANKCLDGDDDDDDNLDYFIREAGDIVGITALIQMDDKRHNPKFILYTLACQLAKFKMLNPDDDDADGNDDDDGEGMAGGASESKSPTNASAAAMANSMNRAALQKKLTPLESLA